MSVLHHLKNFFWGGGDFLKKEIGYKFKRKILFVDSNICYRKTL